MRKISIAIIVCILTGAGMYLALSSRASSPAAPIPAASAASQEPAPVIAEGKVVPARHAALSFTRSGVVAEVLVQAGDSITKGMALARLDTRELALNVAQAQATLAQAQAGYDKLIQQATPQQIAAAQAQIAQAQANLRQTRGNVTEQDITAARATLTQAQAALAQLKAGPKDTQLQSAQASLEQAQANLQSQRDSLSATKTSAQLQMQQAADTLTQAQASYATALHNWNYVQDTGNDPISPTTIGTDGKAKKNKLSEAQRQQYHSSLIEAEASMHSAESALQQAQVSFESARQAEVSGIQSSEAQVSSAEANLAEVRAAADPDKFAAAEAQVAQAKANLNKLLGEQRSGSLDAAAAQVSSAEANLDQITAQPRVADLAAAKAQIQLAEVGLQQAQLALEQSSLTAPFDGAVAEQSLRVGEMAAPSQPAMIVAGTGDWQIETTDLTELSIGRIRVGSRATLSFDALPDVTLQARVTQIAAIGQNQQGDITYTVTLTPETHEPQLRWNMTATVHIDTE